MTDAHHMKTEFSVGGTRGGKIVTVRCSCGLATGTGDDYGRIRLDEIERELRYSLHRDHAAAGVSVLSQDAPKETK